MADPEAEYWPTRSSACISAYLLNARLTGSRASSLHHLEATSTMFWLRSLQISWKRLNRGTCAALGFEFGCRLAKARGVLLWANSHPLLKKHFPWYASHNSFLFEHVWNLSRHKHSCHWSARPWISTPVRMPAWSKAAGVVPKTAARCCARAWRIWWQPCFGASESTRVRNQDSTDSSDGRGMCQNDFKASIWISNWCSRWNMRSTGPPLLAMGIVLGSVAPLVKTWPDNVSQSNFFRPSNLLSHGYPAIRVS